MKTNLYNDTLNLFSRFLHPFSKIHSRNLEEARKERKERKIARGRMEKNDESVGKYLISKGRRVSRLGEGWERPGDQQSENRIVDGRLVARAAGGDAKVPFEDSYFPRSHRCHTSPAILRLSLHCGNHNYTCGCLLIAPPPPGGSSRGEKEGGREGEPCILLRFRFFSSIPSPTLLFLLSRFHLRTSKFLSFEIFEKGFWNRKRNEKRSNFERRKNLKVKFDGWFFGNLLFEEFEKGFFGKLSEVLDDDFCKMKSFSSWNGKRRITLKEIDKNWLNRNWLREKRSVTLFFPTISNEKIPREVRSHFFEQDCEISFA